MNFSIKKATILSVASLALLTSCRGNDPVDNPNSVPTSYEFKRNGETTVAMSGQYSRIDMHSQVKAYGDAAKEMDITSARLLQMVKNENNPFTDGAFYSAAELNGTTKQIWNKLGASASANQVNVHTYFQQLFNELEYLSTQRNVVAQSGVAGIIGGSRLVDDKGIEVIQLMSKSMMGALELDQIMNHYLSDAKLNVDNSVPVQGKNYTAMEHHWDEAFGYTGLPSDPNTDISTNENKPKYRRFWSGYISAVDNSVAGDGIKKEIYDAFLKGRLAIVNKDYTERDLQRDKIRQLMEKVCLIRAVHYLRDGAAVIADPTSTDSQKASAFHAASEGLGFLYALEFTPMGINAPAAHKPSKYINDVRTVGFYQGQASSSLLNAIAQQLAQYGGFNVQDA